MKRVNAFFVLPLLLLASSAFADTITYAVSFIAGNTWQYDYTVENTGSTCCDIEEFSIYFDVNLTNNLSISASPVDWDGIAIQPDTGLPDDGFADWLYLGFDTGIGFGETLGGFSAVFDFLGTGTPGDQFWEIIDPFTFATLASGFTQLDVATVPEPSSITLLAFGLFLIAIYSRRRRPLFKQSQL